MSYDLARKYKVDVSVDGTSWVPLRGITDFSTPENSGIVSADNYDTNGFNSFEKTMTGWKPVVKFEMPTTGGLPSDAGQLLLEATRFQFGDACRIYVRWYNRNGGTDAWSGRAIVDWVPSKTGTGDLAEVTVTFNGDGALTRITNPNTVSALPVITTITPSGKAAGQAVNIYGSGFTGVVPTTGVKFGGTNATDFTFVSDGQITAVLPAGAAGVTTVLVTTGVGGSVQTNNYTRA